MGINGNLWESMGIYGNKPGIYKIEGWLLTGDLNIVGENISAVKRLRYFITINRINVIVNVIVNVIINRKSFFYAKYPLISFSH